MPHHCIGGQYCHMDFKKKKVKSGKGVFHYFTHASSACMFSNQSQRPLLHSHRSCLLLHPFRHTEKQHRMLKIVHVVITFYVFPRYVVFSIWIRLGELWPEVPYDLHWKLGFIASPPMRWRWSAQWRRPWELNNGGRPGLNAQLYQI